MGMRRHPVRSAPLRSRRAVAPLVLVVALAAACGDDGDRTTVTDDPDDTTTTAPADPTTSGAPPTTADGPGPVDDPLVGCPSGPTFPLSALDDVPPVADAPAGVVEAMRTFLDDEEGGFWPQDGWRVLHETADRVDVVHIGDRSTAADTGLSFMTLELVDGRWEWAGASARSDCPLEFAPADGLGIVDWELDPAQPEPGPDDTVVHVLATERACASGEPMGDRLNEPIVLADASQVGIMLTAVPPGGDQDCPDNPAAAVEVDLGEPLGERRLVDGRQVGVELEDLLVGP